MIPFVNADEIAKDLKQREGGEPANRNIAAGRLDLAQMEKLQQARASFATETNLANRTLARRILSLQSAGYSVTLNFLWLPSADMAVARVAQRVRTGGHDIPEETIRRRYRVGLQNFFEIYKPIVDRWRFYDSSEPTGPRLIALGVQRIRQREMWAMIQKEIL